MCIEDRCVFFVCRAFYFHLMPLSVFGNFLCFEVCFICCQYNHSSFPLAFTVCSHILLLSVSLDLKRVSPRPHMVASCFHLLCLFLYFETSKTHMTLIVLK
jgi:hypothetical protein